MLFSTTFLQNPGDFIKDSLEITGSVFCDAISKRFTSVLVESPVEIIFGICFQEVGFPRWLCNTLLRPAIPLAPPLQLEFFFFFF